MSDDYTPTTDIIRAGYLHEPEHWADVRKGADFDRWHAKDRADTVMAFANHFLKFEDWKKARQFANDILEGKA